jgi:hypothetical protein
LQTESPLAWRAIIPRQGFSLYEQSIAQRVDTSSYTYGVGVRVNFLREWKNGFWYVKGGADFARANNLADMKKIEYVERDSITSSGTKHIYSETRGISYTGTKYDHDFAFGLSIETYLFLSK